MTEKHLRYMRRVAVARRGWEMESASTAAVPHQQNGTEGAAVGAVLTEREAEAICDAGGLPLPPRPCAWTGANSADINHAIVCVQMLFDGVLPLLRGYLRPIDENTPLDEPLDIESYCGQLTDLRDDIVGRLEAIEEDVLCR